MGDLMALYYIPSLFFSKFEIGDDIIEWHGKGGVIGVIPVFDNLDTLKKKYPNSEYIDIEVEKMVCGDRGTTLGNEVVDDA